MRQNRNNVLTGGIGKDSFKFTTTGHIDTITDFSVIDDTIILENAVFAALTTTGKLAASQFRIGTNALDADDFIIYNNATGVLLYDGDGNGAGAAVQIATLTGGLSMTNADIVVIQIRSIFLILSHASRVLLDLQLRVMLREGLNNTKNVSL